MKVATVILAGMAAVLVGVSVSVVDQPTPAEGQVLPAVVVKKTVQKPSLETTGSIPVVKTSSIKLPAKASDDLKAGFAALSNKDALAALSIRNSMRGDRLERHILTWAIAISGQKGVPSGEILRARQELEGWPGLLTLENLAEKALAAENPPTDQILKFFKGQEAKTPEGTLLLVRALKATGDTARAKRLLSVLWTQNTLSPDLEDKALAEFSSLLTVADHKTRMELLLYNDRMDQAERFGTLGEAQSLYKAWAAVNRKSAKADALLDAVSDKWKDDPGFLYARIKQLRQKRQYSNAAKLLMQLPKNRADLIVPSEWWAEQRIVSRGLKDAGKINAAYAIVEHSVADNPTDIVEAEFHAGWYALRGLKDPKRAASHFNRILATSNRPISVSRAEYWLGRAADLGDPAAAKGHYQRAAALPATYYGQLAAAHLGLNHQQVAYPVPSDADRVRFSAREAVEAIDVLEDAGQGWRADSLYRALAEQLDSPGELALLATRAERGGNHQLSLQIGKIAYGRGINVPALAFPLGAIPSNANIAGPGKALAYAIARQESSFNVGAVSPANARGLLQILPSTAKRVAKRIGLPWSAERLTTDGGYNATLGANYLGEQIGNFGGSYIMTFIAYNAGPRRVPDWIARYGDPRGKSIEEVVDWVENIPYSETRNYVQRVMENYQVYKLRLGQPSDIEKDLVSGRQG